MPRLRVWIGGALGLAAGVIAFRWVEQDRPAIPERARDAGTHDAHAADAAAPASDPALAGAATIAIAVVDVRTGAPLPGVAIAARGDAGTFRTTSDADGRAAIPAQPGRWRLDASRGGLPFAIADGEDWELGAAPPPDPPLRLAPLAEIPEPLELPAPAPGTGALVGVVTHAGARAADLVVTPFHLGDYGPGADSVHDRVPVASPLPPRRFVGTAGAFRWDGLAPGGWAALVVAPGRGAAVVRATVTASLAGDASIELPAAASASGPVVDQRGGPVPGAVVRARVDGLAIAAVAAGPDGTYVLPELPPGPIELSAAHPGCVGDRAREPLAPGKRTVRGLALVCENADPIVTPVPDEP